MGIYIKNMEIPKSCSDCFAERCIGSDFGCDIIGFEDGNTTCFTRERRKDCPLVEMPPHGRLIDADALKTRVQKLQEWLWDKLTDADVGIVTEDDIRYRIAEESEEYIDDAPTIIESEETK